MNSRSKLKSLLLIALVSFTSASAQNYTINRAPLAKQRYLELPVGTIKPQGWLLEQLKIMRNNSTGHLDEYYWKLKNDNGWLGGKGDGWEETPYWLDGAVPLAYLLDDATLKQKVQKYIDWTINNQRPSGYFGPVTKYERETGNKVEKGEQGDDWWPKMVMLKVMQQYYSATKDPRAIEFMTKYFRYQQQALKDWPLSYKLYWQWAKARGQENLASVYWLYSITKDKFLLDLAATLNKQIYDWPGMFAGRDWVINAAVKQTDEFTMIHHGVNVGMALKTPVIVYQQKKDPRYLQALKTAWTDLMTLHGLPMGMFSADEDLNGNAPTQGTELCTIVETMFSLEQAIAITGDNLYMDALERIAYNALPTQTTDDYNNKQYYQVPNQVEIKRGPYDFTLPCGDLLTNVFGPRTGYTCCLANMHQGWTKLTTHLWFATPDNGLAAMVYAPSTITAKVANNIPVTIKEETNYPFESSVNLNLSLENATRFPIELRIPSWCAEATISLNGNTLQTGKGGQMVRLEQEWKEGDKLTIEFPMQVTVSSWGKNSRAVERGPLVYALKVNGRWEKKVDTVTTSGEYYEVYPTSPWNYGILKSFVKAPADTSYKIIQHELKGNFFWNEKNAPIEIQLKARRISDWQLVKSVACQPVTERYGFYRGEVAPGLETITLIPYGCTKLRITAFPVVKE